MRPGIIASLLIVALWSGVPSAQQRRYIVTAEPIHLGVPSNALCIAVDPQNPQGVWWWEPGTAGCSNRSTGPGVFDAERVTVTRTSPFGRIEFGFRMGLHSRPLVDPPFVDIALVVDEKGMGPPNSQVRVPVEERNDLDIPSFWGGR